MRLQLSFSLGMWSEKLHFELKRLETAHQEHRGYKYKISKYTSLRRSIPSCLGQEPVTSEYQKLKSTWTSQATTSVA